MGEAQSQGRVRVQKSRGHAIRYKPKGARALLLLLLVAAIPACSGLRNLYEASRYGAAHPGARLKIYGPIASTSMAPAIAAGSYVLADFAAYDHASPQRGDVIVFSAPLVTTAPSIKRLIALPGDGLRITSDAVLVNGKPASEPRSAAPGDYSFDIVDYALRIDHGGGPQSLQGPLVSVPPRSLWPAPDRRFLRKPSRSS